MFKLFFGYTVSSNPAWVTGDIVKKKREKKEGKRRERKGREGEEMGRGGEGREGRLREVPKGSARRSLCGPHTLGFKSS